jgi:hypothetical protein
MLLGSAEHPARPRRVEPGEPADLCVLSVTPQTALAELDAGMVAATIIGGGIAYPST